MADRPLRHERTSPFNLADEVEPGDGGHTGDHDRITRALGTLDERTLALRQLILVLALIEAVTLALFLAAH